MATKRRDVQPMVCASLIVITVWLVGCGGGSSGSSASPGGEADIQLVDPPPDRLSLERDAAAPQSQAARAFGGGGTAGASFQIQVFDPSSPPPDRFTPQRDPDARQVQADRMWSVLTAPACWDASFVGGSTVVGTPAAVSQFSFSGGQYRFVGSADTYFGGIHTHDLGDYEGRDTAIVETWTGEVEAIVILNRSQFFHVLKNPDGVPFYTRYSAASNGCT